MSGRYEPVIVKTLRRFVRRGAPQSLLQRIAGGPAHWRVLNAWWNLDGTAVSPPIYRPSLPLGAVLSGLSADERRITLTLIADEAAEADAAFPTLTALAVVFDVSHRQISHDLHLLRESGKLAWHLRGDGHVVRRPVEAASAGTET